jgi:hypothetical protein
MTITLADNQLISQRSRQGKVALFAEAETIFFPKVDDAEIESSRADTKGPTRWQLPQLQSMIGGLGALQAVVFKGVGPGGADIFQGKFEKGSLEHRIWLGPDGKTESANVRPGE